MDAVLMMITEIIRMESILNDKLGYFFLFLKQVFCFLDNS
jgi:hypothetical protein